ncbi:MAG: hypothetical protein R3E66_11520 [bacterium]
MVEKTVGMPGILQRDDPMNPVLFLADMLGVDRDTFDPVWPMPTNMGGPWLIALTTERAVELRERLAGGHVMNTWSAIVPAPPKARGTFKFRGISVEYGCARMQDGLADMQLTPEFKDSDDIDPVHFLLDLLAAQGLPVIGDRERGGVMAAGACRLRLTALFDQDGDLGHSWSAPNTWWPKGISLARETPADVERVVSTPTAKDFTPLQVSRKTLEILDLGHPWAFEDRDTGKRDGFKPGTLVQLRTPEGKAGPFALVEGQTSWPRGYFRATPTTCTSLSR